MNVLLQIGYQHYIMPIDKASKVMELLGAAQAVESYYISSEDAGTEDSESGYYTVRAESMTIQQIKAEPITADQYRRRRNAADERRAARKAAEQDA